jgi:hypothetical protein
MTTVRQPNPVPDPLASVLERHLNVNGFVADWPQALMRELLGHKNPRQEEMFRHQLASAILSKSITPKQYEALTGEDFDTRDDLDAWLRELWKTLYGERPVSTEE